MGVDREGNGTERFFRAGLIEPHWDSEPHVWQGTVSIQKLMGFKHGDQGVTLHITILSMNNQQHNVVYIQYFLLCLVRLQPCGVHTAKIRVQRNGRNNQRSGSTLPFKAGD